MFKDAYFEEKTDILLALGFLLTLGMVVLISLYWLSEPDRQAAAIEEMTEESIERGARLYAENCARCHGNRGQGGEGIVSLNYEGFAEGYSERFLRQTIAMGRRGTLMPAWSREQGGSLTSQQVEDLVTFLRSGKWERVVALVPDLTVTPTPGVEPAVSPTPTPPPPQEVAIKRGAKLFAANCATCHGIVGEGDVGPSLNQAYRLKGHSEDFFYRTIALGRAGTHMKAWSKEVEGGSLDDQEIGDVVAFITSGEWYRAASQAVALAGGAKGPRGKTIFMAKGCPVCHKVKGRGGTDGPDLSDIGARADADYIRQSILEPNAVTVEGYEPDVMPTNFREKLTDAELSELVNYLLSLKTEK